MKRTIYFIIFVLFFVSPILYSQAYDKNKAIAYAEKWWNKFNTNKEKPEDGGPYVDYTRYGGDCAAFVSQCLRAGGLDLSKGTDGYGNAVKPDRVIAGVNELVMHLKKYQIVEYSYITGGADKPEPEFVQPGDPVFVTLGSDKHSIFCVGVENGKNVYNSHTNAYHHQTKSFWGYTNAHCFHIGKYTPSYPSHCNNCKQDGDETGLDCGGSCPPCKDTPPNYAQSTGLVPSGEIRVMEDIVLGGDVRIASGTDVSLLAGGDIFLGSGFEVSLGSSLQATTSRDRSLVTRSFRKVCIRQYNVFTPNGDGINDFWTIGLAGIEYIEVAIFDRWPFRHKVSSQVLEDGSFILWDGKFEGFPVANDHAYYYVGKAVDCTGAEHSFQGAIAIIL